MSSGCLAVEPAAYVRDRVLVEASVKAAGDVADMRRCQQVRQRAERMVERQRLLVEDVDGSTAIFWALSAAIRSASTTIGPREVFTRRAVGFMIASSGAPTRPRVRLLRTRWTETTSARLNNCSLETNSALTSA